MIGIILTSKYIYNFRVYVPDGIYPSLNYTLNSYQAVTLLSEAMNVISINRDSNSAERALFSRYLLHVVGDIHQPLHAIALFNETYKSGDRGGNSLNVIRTNGEETNLHSFWDNGAFLLQN